LREELVRRLVTLDLWPQLSLLAKKAKRRLAAVAYVTRAVEGRFGAGDLLVVDASDQAIKSGVTATAVLRAAHRRGARLLNRPGLHAKVLLLDDVAVVGSANISATSVNQKIEAALITDDRATTTKVRKLIGQLARHSQEIDEQFLGRIGRIKVSRRRPESGRRNDQLLTKRTGSELDLPRAASANGVESEKEKTLVSVLTTHGVRLDNPRVAAAPPEAQGSSCAFVLEAEVEARQP
jgi:phosphatidylserine/phosphatidylglycerophosphate/cardiolipin synthase-like enzyme